LPVGALYLKSESEGFANMSKKTTMEHNESLLECFADAGILHYVIAMMVVILVTVFLFLLHISVQRLLLPARESAMESCLQREQDIAENWTDKDANEIVGYTKGLYEDEANYMSRLRENEVFMKWFFFVMDILLLVTCWCIVLILRDEYLDKIKEKKTKLEELPTRLHLYFNVYGAWLIMAIVVFVIMVYLFVVLTVIPFLSSNASHIEPNHTIVTLARHIDGDTTDFYIDGVVTRVRYIAIDADEIFGANATELGIKASEHVRMRLENAEIIMLELDPTREQYCRFDRTLAWVWVDDILLQEELVRMGLARIAFAQGNEIHLYKLQAAALEEAYQ